jgi:hypothetical protein
MAKLSTILQERFKKREKPKMSELAEKASAGQYTVFAGLFGNSEINESEKKIFEDILQKYSLDTNLDHANDLSQLLSITSEIKAINNQAVILHGERIKKAQEVLKKYREGAFSAWLKAAYGNRQTPYNFLQYYEFFLNMPKTLHPQIEAMPRQAVYTLASREGLLEKKEEIVRNYRGETKQQMINLIRSIFPLDRDDKRQGDVMGLSIKLLERVAHTLTHAPSQPSRQEKNKILTLLADIRQQIIPEDKFHA